MKIQCDVCNKDEASVFCLADEAALCAACDHRVHHANKLAGKHQRFSLHHPLPKQAPVCDICQERRAFLFCQQDRAILCKECDNSIHKANEHTQKHSRFLLTGVKLSSTSTLYSPSPSTLQESASSSSNINGTNPTAKCTTTTTTVVVQRADVAAPESCDKINNPGQLQTSSISEYLIDMLPGWHVEDILDSSPSPNYGFSKNGDNDASWTFWDAGLESNYVNNVFPKEKMGIWVPQVSPCLNQTQNQSVDISFGATTNGFNGFCNNTTNNSIKSSRKWSEDNSFAVPQIRPAPSSSFKRSRNLW